MNNVVEFSGCKLAIRIDAIQAIDIDPDDKKSVRLFVSGVHTPGGYCIHHLSEEDALYVYNRIVKGMKEGQV